MKTFPLHIFLLGALLATSCLCACQRIDVDEHEYDTVTPYLPDIPPDPEVVGAVSPQQGSELAPETDGDAETDAESPGAGAGNVIRHADKVGKGYKDDLSEQVIRSTGELHLQLMPPGSSNESAAPQK